MQIGAGSCVVRSFQKKFSLYFEEVRSLKGCCYEAYMTFVSSQGQGNV